MGLCIILVARQDERAMGGEDAAVAMHESELRRFRSRVCGALQLRYRLDHVIHAACRTGMTVREEAAMRVAG